MYTAFRSWSKPFCRQGPPYSVARECHWPLATGAFSVSVLFIRLGWCRVVNVARGRKVSRACFFDQPLPAFLDHCLLAHRVVDMRSLDLRRREVTSPCLQSCAPPTTFSHHTHAPILHSAPFQQLDATSRRGPKRCACASRVNTFNTKVLRGGTTKETHFFLQFLRFSHSRFRKLHGPARGLRDA